jgi:hypothetical protein
MNFLRLSGMGIGTIAFGRADIDVPPLQDYHLVIFCLTGSAIVHSGNIDLTIDSRSGIVCYPDLALRASSRLTESNFSCASTVADLPSSMVPVGHGFLLASICVARGLSRYF